MLVAPYRSQGVLTFQCQGQPFQRGVLFVGIRLCVGAFQLNPNGKIVAARPTFKLRYASMPGAVVSGYKLHEAAIAADQEVSRHVQPTQLFQPRVRGVIQPVQEQVDNFRPAKDSRRQADIVDDQQIGLGVSGALIAMGRRLDPYTGPDLEPAMSIKDQRAIH